MLSLNGRFLIGCVRAAIRDLLRGLPPRLSRAEGAAPKVGNVDIQQAIPTDLVS
jgi:hypothetical protein